MEFELLPGGLVLRRWQSRDPKIIPRSKGQPVNGSSCPAVLLERGATNLGGVSLFIHRVYPDRIDGVFVFEKQAIDQFPQHPIPPHALDRYLGVVNFVIDPDESNPEGGQSGRVLRPVFHAVASGDGRIGEVLVMKGAQRDNLVFGLRGYPHFLGVRGGFKI